MTNDNTGGYNRSAALAIWAGTAAGLATMALHPTGRDVVHNATEGGANALVFSVHLLAMLGEALVLAGAVAIAARLRARLDLAVSGYVFFAVGALTVIVAAAASGLIAPSTVRGIGDVEAAERGMILNDLHYTGLINQARADQRRLHVGRTPDLVRRNPAHPCIHARTRGIRHRAGHTLIDRGWVGLPPSKHSRLRTRSARHWSVAGSGSQRAQEAA